MRRTALPAATVVLIGLAAAPSSADTVSLNEACATTLNMLATTGGTTESAIFAGPRFSLGNRIVDSVSGTYGIIAQEPLTSKERKAALSYLNAARAQAWFSSGRFYGSSQWVGSYPQALAAASGLPQDCAAAAGPLVSSAGTTFVYTNVSVDIVDGAVARWGQVAFAFGPQQLQIPPGPLVAYPKWSAASESASLNSTLRSMTRTVARTANPTPASLYRQLRDSVPAGRAVPLQVHRLRQGGLISGRNAYTKTYHAWRVYLKNGTPVARKVAP